MKIVQAPIVLKGSRMKDKSKWKCSVDNNGEQERAMGSKHVEMLKEKNKASSEGQQSKLDSPVNHHRYAGGVYSSATEKGDAMFPKELVIHEYTRQGYKSKKIQLNADGSIPDASTIPSVSVEVVSSAIEKLERDMAEAEAGIEVSEDELSGQYLDLEANAHKMGIRDYEKRLAILEKTRQYLEDERSKLHESFGLRMESIKSQHTEAVARADAIEQRTITSPNPFSLSSSGLSNKSTLSPTGKLTQSSLKSPPRTPLSTSSKPKASNPSSSSSVKSAAPNEAASLLVRKRGWISGNTDKSHNVVLKRLAEKSEKETKERHLPSAIKDRILPTSSSRVETSQLDKIRIHRKGDHVETFSVDQAWSSFLNNLKSSSDAWGTDALKIRSTIQTSRKSKNIGVIPRNDDSASSTSKGQGSGTGTGGSNIAAVAIRNEELGLMLAEDRRRKMWLKQQELQSIEDNLESQLSLSDTKSSTSSQIYQHLKSNENRLNTLGSSSKQQVSSSQLSKSNIVSDPPVIVPKDPESALKWLTAFRQLELVDRASRTLFYFSLIKEVIDSKKQQFNYVFSWKEKVSTPNNSGSIDLRFIKNAKVSQQDSTQFIIVLEESPLSLKSTGGRVMLTVRCTSDAECLKYVASFEVLKASLLVNSSSSNTISTAAGTGAALLPSS